MGYNAGAGAGLGAHKATSGGTNRRLRVRQTRPYHIAYDVDLRNSPTDQQGAMAMMLQQTEAAPCKYLEAPKKGDGTSRA